MADFNALETLINAYIKQNGVQAITGNILNGVLRGMVNALGKGYTIIGVATPNTDPGTMTGPCAYYASTYGTYTHFDNIVVPDGEIAMLIYDEQAWHKEKMWRLDAEASVDANVGTPVVQTSFEDGLLTFNFKNIKGEPGTDGDAAGFGTIAATVDDQVGTPAVSVSTSGPDTAKNMTFAFRNLKGETGVTSVVVTVDNTVGTPSCAVSLNGQELHLDFHGLKGAQGDTGVSADYPITIANNLTTNDPTNALSAAMGVQLESEISQLELKVDGIKITSTDVANGNVHGYTLVDYRLSGQGLWVSPGKTVFIPVTDIGETMEIVNVGTYSYKYAFVKSTTVTSGQAADYCSGQTMKEVSPGAKTTIVKDQLPLDCNYVAVVYKQTNNDPYAVDYVLVADSLKNEIKGVNEKADGVNDKFGFSATGTQIVTNADGKYIIVDTKRIAGTGKWANIGTAYFYPVTKETERIVITPDSSVSDIYKYAFLKTIGSYTSGAYPDYCSGESNAHEVANNITTTLLKSNIPADCNYVYISIKNAVASNIVASVSVNLQSQLNNINADILSVRKEIEEVVGEELTSAKLIANEGGLYDVVDGVRISDAGSWVANGIAFFLPVTQDIENIVITPKYGEGVAYKYAFLTTDNHTVGTTPDYCDGYKVVKVMTDKKTTITKDMIPSTCVYIYICLKQNTADPICVEKVNINGFVEMVDLFMNELQEAKMGDNSTPYYGERINLRGYTVDNYGGAVIKDALVIGGQTYYGQGADVFGNRAFRLHKNGICEVFDIANYNNITKLAEYNLGSYGASNHSNCCNFGNELSDTGFPYLYVAGLNNGTCYVEKVSESSAELVQTITLLEGIAGNLTVGDDGKLWFFYGDNLGSTMYFYKFDLPDVDDGDVTISLSDAIDSWTDTDCTEYLAYYYQGGKIYNGRLYVLFGQSGAGQKRYMLSYNINTHQRVSIVDFTETIPHEIEDCGIRNGRMIVFTNGSTGLNVVNFI